MELIFITADISDFLGYHNTSILHAIAPDGTIIHNPVALKSDLPIDILYVEIRKLVPFDSSKFVDFASYNNLDIDPDIYKIDRSFKLDVVGDNEFLDGVDDNITWAYDPEFGDVELKATVRESDISISCEHLGGEEYMVRVYCNSPVGDNWKHDYCVKDRLGDVWAPEYSIFRYRVNEWTTMAPCPGDYLTMQLQQSSTLSWIMICRQKPFLLRRTERI
jgi:hypothetical protein